MKRFFVLLSVVVIIALITLNLNNNKLIHRPISIEKVDEIVVFQEFYNNESGGGVTIEHLNSRVDTTGKEAEQLVQWFNSVSNDHILPETELPRALAGVSFEMKNKKRVVVHYHEGVFYVANKNHLYSFVHHELKNYFENALKQNES